MRTHAIPCPNQPLTRVDATVLVAKLVLTPLVPIIAFTTGQGMKRNNESFS